jgi:hypothetical protein
MIAPVLILNSYSQSRETQETQISCSDHFTNTISSFLCEENSGEEEETGFEFIEVSSVVFPKELRQTSWIETREIISSRPPLFTLFHTYII